MFSMVLDADSGYGFTDLLKSMNDYLKLYGFKKLSNWDEPSIPPDFLTITTKEDENLSEEYNNFKNLLSFCEEHMSDVIATGPKVSFEMSIFVAVTSWIIPILIGIPAIKFIIKGIIHLLSVFG